MSDFVELCPVFESSVVKITTWRCLQDGAELRAERHHVWPTLTLGFSGACVVESLGKKAVFDPASINFHPPFRPYRVSHPFGCGDRGANVSIRPDVASEVLGKHGFIGQRSLSETAIPAPSRAYARLTCAMVGLAKNAPVEPAEVEAAVLELLEHVATFRRGASREVRSSRVDEEHRRITREVQGVLALFCRESVDLDEVAAAVGVSCAHMSRVFRRVTGTPIHRYRKRLRLYGALDSLLEGRGGLADLAFEAGFSSHSHFTEAFRKEFGVPPSRAQLRPSPPSPASRGQQTTRARVPSIT